jgi:hypothetical protein
MDFGIIFLLFVLANSYFMYKAGEKAGKFVGMISIVQFLKEKDVLKDKKDITGFKKWPLAIQLLYANPDPDIFKD